MNNFTAIRSLVLTLCVGVVMTGCDLSESVHDEVTTENFFQTEQQFASAMGDAYNPLTALAGGGGPQQLNEATTDEIIVPARGQDWSEGGFWYRVNSHQWNIDEGTFNGFWQDYYSGVNNANRLIFQFESAVEAGAADPEQAGEFISELKAMRAFYYYWLLDAFGNVPIITGFEDVEENPQQPCSQGPGCFDQGRQQVFEFVEQELLDNIDDISDDVSSTYGRMNKYVAHMTLAKLYMNAEVYTGTSRWDDALTHLNEIINSGEYNLADDYHANFQVDNSGSPENIFVVPYDDVFLGGFFLHMMTLHYGSQDTYSFQTQPWNGWSATQKMYESVIDSDQNPGPQGEVWGTEPTSTDAGLERVEGTLDDRRGNFIVGPQFTSGGDRVTDSGIFSDFDENGEPLTFTPAINDLENVACRQCGARIGKYEFEQGIESNMNNDYVIYRYSDVLLMKAEALWRQNSSDSEALALVNQVRNRSGVDDFSSLDADKLLAERGREMFFELLRRQDLIRFDGKEGDTRYNDTWKFKGVSDSHRNVAPIPQTQLETNPNLVQNPGYPAP